MAYKESYAGRINRKLNKKLHVVEVAAGRQKADLVLKNATYVNVFCNQLSRGDIAVASGLIAGMGEHYEGEIEVDMSGKLVLPGFVDAHIHLESSLVSPKEFAKAVLPHGTTTVITDPHEIANADTFSPDVFRLPVRFSDITEKIFQLPNYLVQIAVPWIFSSFFCSCFCLRSASFRLSSSL